MGAVNYLILNTVHSIIVTSANAVRLSKGLRKKVKLLVTLDSYLNKMNLYSTIGAQNTKDTGKKASVIRDIVLRPLGAFLKMYLLKGGVLEGWIGFVLSLTYANYTLNKYVKLKLISV